MPLSKNELNYESHRLAGGAGRRQGNGRVPTLRQSVVIHDPKPVHPPVPGRVGGDAVAMVAIAGFREVDVASIFCKNWVQ